MISCMPTPRIVRRTAVMTIASAVVFAAAFAGCGGTTQTGPTGTVSGKVNVKGQPMTTGRVNLYSNELSAGGGSDIGADGSYAIKDQLPVGKYAVTVFATASKDIPPPADPSKPAEAAKPAAPKASYSPKYMDPTQSPLSTEIKAGENTANFDLTE